MASILSRNEWIFVTLLFLLLFTFTQLPVLWGYAIQTDDLLFTGRTLGILNYYTYHDWMIQASEGDLLFTTHRTSEPVPALFVSLLFLAIGMFSGITGLGILGSYYLFYVFIGFGFFAVLMLFIALLTDKTGLRKTALVITLTSSGLGFLLWGLFKVIEAPYFFSEATPFSQRIFPVDIWLTDVFPLMSLHSYLLHFATMALLVGVFGLFIVGWKRESWKHIIGASVVTWVLIGTHVYEMVTAFAVISVFMLVSLILNGWKNIHLYLLYVATAVPLFIFNILVFLGDPLFSEITRFNIVLSPNPFSYVIGLGIPLLLALVYIGRTVLPQIKSIDVSILFVSVWAVTQFFLVYLPVPFQARFGLGMMIPVGILAAFGLYQHVLPRIRERRRTLALVLIILIMLPSNALFITKELYKTDAMDNHYFIHADDEEAIDWLVEHTDRNDVVLSGILIGAPLSGESHRVFLGHVDMTINSGEKQLLVEQFYGEMTLHEQEQFIAERDIAYVYYGDEEKGLGSLDVPWDIVFKNDRVIVFNVQNA